MTNHLFSKLLLSFPVLVAATPAWALQPIDIFVSGARTHNPQNHEADANRALAESQAGESTARALPGLSAGATYTRNQWDVSFAGLSVMPRNQFDAAVTLSVPLIDLAKFARISAANRFAEAAAHQRDAVARMVEGQVVQLYYQLAADLALVAVAHRALDVVQLDLKLTESMAEAGSASALDLSRGRAEVEQRRQQLTSAELDVKLATQAIVSRTGVRPETDRAVDLDDDLHDEPPLDRFMAGVATTPAVLAATRAREGSQRNADAQGLALLPALSAALLERYTNATGFLNGHHQAYAASVSLQWVLDIGSGYAIRSRKAEAGAALAREQAAGLAVTDAVIGAYESVAAGIARSRSARLQSAATAKAADIARARYRSGAASHLEMIQADRDAFVAEAMRIMADSNLLNARRQLRLASGVD